MVQQKGRYYLVSDFVAQPNVYHFADFDEYELIYVEDLKDDFY